MYGRRVFTAVSYLRVVFRRRTTSDGFLVSRMFRVQVRQTDDLTNSLFV